VYHDEYVRYFSKENVLYCTYKTIRKLLTIDWKCTSVSTILINWWYNEDQRLQPSCLSHQTEVRGTRHYIFGNTPRLRFSQVWQCNSTRTKNHTLHPSLAIVFVPVSLSSFLVPIRLLSPLVVSYVVCGKGHFLLSVSSRFWSEIRWQTKTIKSYATNVS
jgi:hypothetical protein